MTSGMRAFHLVATVVCLLAVDHGSVQAQSRPARPNIILCMADDQGWGDVGYAGHAVLKTPSLDTMAAAGLRFDHFYAAAPVCSPTRGSVMTGRHPNRFGCFSWGFPMRPQEITIAQKLKEAGYTTGHFGKWHLGSVQKTSPVNPGAFGFSEWISAPNFFDNDPILSRDGIAVQMKGESSQVAMEAALAFIRKHAKDPQPMFAVVWFGSPHSPHKASERNQARYAGQKEKLKNFYGEISGIDDAMGTLRNELRTLGIQNKTMLWYCSDNGGLPGLGVTGGRGNKGDIYEGGLRVPGILEWPGHIAAGRKTDVPVNTVDIYPTLLEIAGIRSESQRVLDGISIVPLIDGAMKSRPKPMGFWQYPTAGIRESSDQIMADLLKAQQGGDEIGDRAGLELDAGKIDRQYPDNAFPGHAAWLDWPWKLHRIENKKGIVTIELYNLAEDPQESADLSGRSPERVERMLKELNSWQMSVVTSLNGKDY